MNASRDGEAEAGRALTRGGTRMAAAPARAPSARRVHAALAYLWIGIGSALGGVARYGLGEFVAGRIGDAFPWGTIVINVSGCFAIGLFATLTGPDGRLYVPTLGRQFVMAGFCGGYTTFSSFALQTLMLAAAGQPVRAAANVAASLALCLAGVWLGHRAATAING